MSLWEKNWFFNYDTAIIGSGIVGLSTAASILEADPTHKVLIFERGLISTGASTRNAGFACFGSLTEILSDISFMGEETSIKLVKARYEGLMKLRARLGDEALDFKAQGGHEVIMEEMLPKLNQMKYLNDLLRPIFKEDVYSLANHKIEELGFNKDVVKAMVFNKFEGQIDSGRAMVNLTRYVEKLGAKILTGATVIDYKKNTDGLVQINVKNPMENGQPYAFMAKSLVICTNAFTGPLVKGLDIFPARGQVVVTKPIKGLKLKGIFHYDCGYYYFRDYYGRILLGGGRNLDIEGEKTTDLNTTKLIMERLRFLLKEVIVPGTPFEIEHEWAGIMCFGHGTKSPIVEEHEENIYVAVRMSGMGVALASNVGEQIRDSILKKRGQTAQPKPRL